MVGEERRDLRAKQVRWGGKPSRQERRPHLLQDVLDAALLLLVRVENLEKGLVSFRLVGESLLDGRDV